MKQASRDTYEEIRRNGTLSRLRLKVFEFIAINPGRTILDASHWVDKSKSVSGRFGELEKMGLIYITGKVKIGNHTHNCYKITGRTKPRPMDQQELIEKINQLKTKGYRYLNEASRCEKVLQETIRG